MPKQADEYIAENRQRIRGVDRRFIEVDSNQERDFSFGPNTITVDVEIELYKRSTGTQIIPGHADPDHGFGRGTFGDDRGAWSLETDAEASAQFTKNGRKAIAEALDGQAGAVEVGVAGVDSTTASTDDTALGDERERRGIFATNDANNKVRTHAIYPATIPTGAVEYGLVDGDGRLLARVTVSSPALASDDEVKANIIVTFAGDGIGKAVITDDGETAIADSFKNPKSNVGPIEFAFGTGSTEFSKSDSSLTSESFRKALARELGRDFVNARTHVYDVDPQASPALGDPHSFDLSEMGVFDNSGRMLWATTFRTFTKDEDVGFNAASLIQVT